VETFSDKSLSRAATLLILMVAFLAMAAPVFGQAATGSGYDLSATTEIRGEIAQFGAVPGGDAIAQVMAPDSSGQIQQWTVTLGKAADMRKAGLTPFALAPGVQVVISGNPAANAGEPRILAQKLTADSGFAWTRPPPAP
jgi:hypothetical protein